MRMISTFFHAKQLTWPQHTKDHQNRENGDKLTHAPLDADYRQESNNESKLAFFSMMHWMKFCTCRYLCCLWRLFQRLQHETTALHYHCISVEWTECELNEAGLTNDPTFSIYAVGVKVTRSTRIIYRWAVAHRYIIHSIADIIFSQHYCNTQYNIKRAVYTFLNLWIIAWKIIMCYLLFLFLRHRRDRFLIY